MMNILFKKDTKEGGKTAPHNETKIYIRPFHRIKTTLIASITGKAPSPYGEIPGILVPAIINLLHAHAATRMKLSN